MRRLVWPALLTALMLALTTGLGLWQLQRLEWKRALLADIERGETAPPVPLGPEPRAFSRVVVAGAFAPETARYGVELRSRPGIGPVMGAHVMNLLLPAAGPPLVVDRGWAPLDTPAPPPAGDVRVEAYIRPPDQPVWFGPKDDPATRRFYTLDPATIGAGLGRPVVAPFVLVALGPAGLPEPATALPRPPNDHLSYAITWFGLATALLVVFGLYVRQTLQQGAEP